MQLPYFQSTSKVLNQLQTKWSSILNPLLAQTFTQGNQLTGINLVAGNNTINHLLSRQQIGWMITDQNANSQIYRSAPFNAQTLQLNSSNACTVNIYVF